MHDVIARVDDDNNCKPFAACLSSVLTTVADSDTCQDGTVVVAIAAANIATTVVVADVVVASTDVDSGKTPDGADLDAVPAEKSPIAASPNDPRVKPTDNKLRPSLLGMASLCIFLMCISILSRR